MQVTDTSQTSKGQRIKVGAFMATKVRDDLLWAEGAIQPQSRFNTETDQRTLTEAVLASIEPVSDSELPYSSCTDGRIPVQLANGEKIPVREQMVGADMVSAFYVAEVLGARFYKDVAAPVAARVKEVADFLHENDVLPSSHIACGAGAGFVAIMQNIVRFSADERFVNRRQELIPADVYSAALHDEMIQSVRQCLQLPTRYEGLTAQTFLDAVIAVSGSRAIAELKDDGRGVHGHVEEQIIRIRVPGYAINEAKVAELTGGREVFGVNDVRIEKIARLFGRGNDDDFKMAYMALEDFANAGHGTLAKGLSTWIVEAA